MSDLQNKINELYKTFGYLNKKDFINFSVNELEDKYKKDDIKKLSNEVVESKPDYQLTAQKRHIVKYEIEKLPGSFQMDLVFFNNTSVPFLLIIDVVSRKCWIYYVKSKKEEDIYPVFENWFYQGLDHKDENSRFVGSILSDEESGIIYGKKFLDLFDKNHIRFILKETNEHNVMKILDRCVRTIKDMFYRRINTYTDEEFNYINNIKSLTNIVYDVVDDYNAKPHSSLDNLTPNEVYDNFEIQDKLYKESHNRNMIKRKKDTKYNVNDYVRLKERKNNKLEKSKYYTDKVYKIHKISPFSYSVKNIDDSMAKEFNPRNIGSYKFKPSEIKRVPVNSISTNGKFRLQQIKSIIHNVPLQSDIVQPTTTTTHNIPTASRFGRVYKKVERFHE